jgi:hypothetical protein
VLEDSEKFAVVLSYDVGVLLSHSHADLEDLQASQVDPLERVSLLVTPSGRFLEARGKANFPPIFQPLECAFLQPLEIPLNLALHKSSLGPVSISFLISLLITLLNPCLLILLEHTPLMPQLSLLHLHIG